MGDIQIILPISLALQRKGRDREHDLCAAWISCATAQPPLPRATAVRFLTTLKRALEEKGYTCLKEPGAEGWAKDEDGEESILNFDDDPNTPGIFFLSEEFNLSLDAFGYDVQKVISETDYLRLLPQI